MRRIIYKSTIIFEHMKNTLAFCQNMLYNEKKGTGKSMKTHESEEMYLETILLLKSRKANIRSVDIVEELGYAKSSVSRAMGLLAARGYIVVNEYDEIVLTEAGERKAADIYERHRVITQLLIGIGADAALAEDNACRIEHVISPELFEIMKEYSKNH